MNKVKIINLNFDFRTKIVMLICIIIAICIIIYSFYNICIKNGIKKIDILDIQDFANILSYEAEYDVTVNSNKNTNTYRLKEDTNIETNTYRYILDNKFNIDIINNEIKIYKENISYEYSDIMNYDSNNFISFSSIINIIRKINNNELKGNIKRVEIDDKIIYKINLEEEYIKKIKNIDICFLKNENKISEIKMFNFDNNEQYYIKFAMFVVKK